MEKRPHLSVAPARSGLAVALALLMAGTDASASLAPDLSANHAAGRQSDTGFGGQSPGGGYGANVPVDLPAARGGLTIPFSVTYIGSGFGAVGDAWDVPLSYIHILKTTAHRRPHGENQSVPERVEMILAGASVSLVLNEAGTAWVGRAADSQIEVKRNGDGVLRAFDGSGQTFDFSAQSPLAGRRLLGGDFYLLRAVTNSVGNRVELGYDIESQPISGTETGTSIRLKTLSYNLHPSRSQCFKHRVLLNYSAPGRAPLNVGFSEGHALASSKYLTSLSVRARANCDQGEEALSDYQFIYKAADESGLPRLHKVTATGRQGTPERSITIPIAEFNYGALKREGDRHLRFESAEQLGPPNVPSRTHYRDGIASTDKGISHQMLLDLTGDGRPDFLNVSNGEEHVYVNKAGLKSVEFQFVQSRSVSHWTEYRTPVLRQFSSATTRITDEVRQFIDMNADGRMDYVVANADAPPRGTPDEAPPTKPEWTIWLNTPDPSNPDRIVWQPRTVSMENVRSVLDAAGHDDDGVSLSRKTTVPKGEHLFCWRAQGGSWHRQEPRRVLPDEPVQPVCPGAESGGAGRTVAPLASLLTKTITEWEIKDINGDGYPDFVYNASSVRRDGEAGHRPEMPAGPDGATTWTAAAADMRASTQTRVLLNVAGALIEDGQTVFGSPIALASADTCGVARWELSVSTATGTFMKSASTCSFQDVNGDGLADRVLTSGDGDQRVTVARLGTGASTSGFISSATLTLPGPVASQTNLAYCRTVTSFFENVTGSVLRDVNGDGTPDYISAIPGSADVYFGTGSGFTPKMPISAESGSVSISREIGNCFDPLIPALRPTLAWTDQGLYDLDGDGLLELVQLTGNSWRVQRLSPATTQIDVGARTVGAPATGRLISIDNGYGAITRIGYRSAKDDTQQRHDIPGAEIVVAAETVQDSSGATLIEPTRFAYGGISNYYSPLDDRFVRTAYQRSVALTGAGSNGDSATMTIRHGLVPFTPGADRFARYALVGAVASTTTLHGDLPTDPWSLLSVDIDTDARRTSGSEFSWQARQLAHGATPGGSPTCLDLIYPYDAARSKREALPGDNACARRGLSFRQGILTWRGEPGLESAVDSTRTVKTYSEQLVDDLGRTTQITDDNDLSRATDDVCTSLSYADPVGSEARVLSAVRRKEITDCAGKVLSLDTFEYDGNGAGTMVSKGLLTAVTRSRRNLQTGQPVDPQNPTAKLFQNIYDAAGNLASVTKVRDDGATSKTSYEYDAFGLQQTKQTLTGTNADGSTLPALATETAYDPISLAPTKTTSTTGAVYGVRYDGFTRPTMQTITLANGVEKAVGGFAYHNFAAGSSQPRQLESKSVRDGVAPAQFSVAKGSLVSATLDALGREVEVRGRLGADYNDAEVMLGKRLYDSQGRIRFAALPHAATDNFATTYGTTYFFDDVGRLHCQVRGKGLQQSSGGNESAERFASCLDYGFGDNQELLTIQHADTKLGNGARRNVEEVARFSATGLLVEHSTQKNGVLFDRSTREYDRFGNLRKIVRWAQPDSGDASPSVVFELQNDSIGLPIASSESGDAQRSYVYDSWGQLVEARWFESRGNSPGNRVLRSQYDAYGRLLRKEELANGVVDQDALATFFYDVPETIATPALATRNTLGRLSKASMPHYTRRLSYDEHGVMEMEIHTDTSVPNPINYVERVARHDNGDIKQRQFLLPDRQYAAELLDYTYDSAHRLRSVQYTGTSAQTLYSASGATAVDVLGRVRVATYGQATVTSSYPAEGRPVLSHLKLAGATGSATSREVAFNPIVVSPLLRGMFDPAGRELGRREARNGTANAYSVLQEYDEMGRLAVTKHVLPSDPGSVIGQRSFHYDALGNVLGQTDNGLYGAASSIALSYREDDADQICRIAYGSSTAPPSSACEVQHDSTGNVVSMPTRSGEVRSLEYFLSGATRSLSQGQTVAHYRYDPFGQVQQLQVDSTTADFRRDKHFGGGVLERLEGGNAVLNRKVQLPGAEAILHGANGEWTFVFGEQRGTRWVLDQAGNVVQDTQYRPYGEVVGTEGATPGTTRYQSRQWNGGDLLAAFGLNQLGARLYDPAIGRFLSRDPLRAKLSSNAGNPYGFAFNDPMNRSDWSGLNPQLETTISPHKDCGGNNCQREDETTSGSQRPAGSWTFGGASGRQGPGQGVVFGPSSGIAVLTVGPHGAAMINAAGALAGSGTPRSSSGSPVVANSLDPDIGGTSKPCYACVGGSLGFDYQERATANNKAVLIGVARKFASGEWRQNYKGPRYRIVGHRSAHGIGPYHLIPTGYTRFDMEKGIYEHFKDGHFEYCGDPSYHRVTFRGALGAADKAADVITTVVPPPLIKMVPWLGPVITGVGAAQDGLDIYDATAGSESGVKYKNLLYMYAEKMNEATLGRAGTGINVLMDLGGVKDAATK